MLQLGNIVFDEAHGLAPQSIQRGAGRWNTTVQQTNRGPVVQRTGRGLKTYQITGQMEMRALPASALLQRIVAQRTPDDPEDTRPGSLTSEGSTVFNESIEGYHQDGRARPLQEWDGRRGAENRAVKAKRLLGQFMVLDFSYTDSALVSNHHELLSWSVTLLEVPAY